MALSRLRHPAISRAPSLFRARLLSSSSPLTSSRSLSGFHARQQETFTDADGSLLRPVNTYMLTGDNRSSSKLKVGVRNFSTSEVPPHTVLGMPALSPTMTQGNIAKWRKKEGDKIEVGDILCEIETDKATLEFECLEEGFLAKIMVAEGSKDVPVGQPIAIMVEDEEDIQKVPTSLAGESGVTDDQSLHKEVKNDGFAQDSSKLDFSELPPHTVVQMPALSPTMTQGNIAKWMKKEGDKIDVGDVICEIETDKATLEFECLEEGYLAKILAPEGTKDVAVGQPIGITVEELDDVETIKANVPTDAKVKEEKPAHHDIKETGPQKSGFRRISPAAKLIIAEYGLDPSSISASGPHGTLLKGDVLAAVKTGKVSKKLSSSEENKSQSHPKSSVTAPSDSKSASKQLESYEDLPNSQIRKVIAKRLLESKQNTPHLYLSADVVLDPLLSFRNELKEKHGVKVSVNDIVIKAVAVALRNVPGANAYWDVEKEEVVLCDSVDISIAVATDKGLMTPIIRNADQKSISSISSEVKELAEKARTGKLKPNEFQGGTFSISNLGMYPVDHFCAIINPPQACILAVGRGNKFVEPVVGSDGIERPAVVSKMKLTLSTDHRVFDGKLGAAFVSALSSNFSDIQRMLL